MEWATTTTISIEHNSELYAQNTSVCPNPSISNSKQDLQHGFLCTTQYNTQKIECCPLSFFPVARTSLKCDELTKTHDYAVKTNLEVTSDGRD